MSERKEILARVKETAARREDYANQFSNLTEKSPEAVYPLLRGYILERFLLPEELADTDELMELANRSLLHVLELKKKGLFREELSQSCSGVSSVIAKKVLLMRAIQQDFSVSMTPEQSANLTTIWELASFLADEYAKERL